MAEATLASLGEQVQTLIGAVRELSGEVDGMRSEIDGGFYMMRGTDTQIEGLRRIVDAHEQRLKALERGMGAKAAERGE
jgi:hypothetical protein